MTEADRVQLLEAAQRLTEDRVLLLEERHSAHALHIEQTLDRIFAELRAISAGGSANCIKHQDRIIALEKIAEENKKRIDGKASRVNIAAVWSVVAAVSLALLSMWMQHIH